MTQSRRAAEGLVSREFGRGPGKSIPPACGLQAQTPQPELPRRCHSFLVYSPVTQVCLSIGLPAFSFDVSFVGGVLLLFFLIQIIYMRLTLCKGT